ncbi:hypothetical protein AK830_g4296 [Neonectria ditissima]|uniref:DUF7924 domain-containing protein n=1 Tax=Neonectria ditissima TaxID=78410 RepID=A0A0P7BNC3_9HYPO|nr:hypothetical protein AK830_g4296 [Neonectria ditissima]
MPTRLAAGIQLPIAEHSQPPKGANAQRIKVRKPRPQRLPNTPHPQRTPIQRKRRKRTIEDAIDPSPDPPPKRLRTSPVQSAAGESQDHSEVDSGGDRCPIDPIDFWTRQGQWPREYFDFDMEHRLARKRSTSSLPRKRSNSATSTTPSDQKPREEKSAQYRDPRYETLLATKGTYMETSELGITVESKRVCEDLLFKSQTTPQGSIFDNPTFEKACKNLQNKNEARIVQDISRLIVPSAETLALYDKRLSILTESVNEEWNNSIPVTGKRPQPDYAAGFRRQAFTEDQLAKLSPFLGDFIAGDLSLFMATYYVYFPFLACEVKCGAAALDIADRQNAHSMTLAARAVVELFRLVQREDEIDRQILAFSISHDHRSVRIYGCYLVINRENTTYYRHPIRTFDFTELDGREKWTTYQFTKNIYDIWMPHHYKKICSAIDQLPSKSRHEAPSLSEATGLSQSLASHHLVHLETDTASLRGGQKEEKSRQETLELAVIRFLDRSSHMEISEGGGTGIAEPHGQHRRRRGLSRRFLIPLYVAVLALARTVAVFLSLAQVCCPPPPPSARMCARSLTMVQSALSCLSRIPILSAILCAAVCVFSPLPLATFFSSSSSVTRHA